MRYDKPMLACTVTKEQLLDLTEPVVCQPKYDGIRCIITPDGPRTRTGKEIPNLFVREILKEAFQDTYGWDCELIFENDYIPTSFSETQSIIMSHKHPWEEFICAKIFDRMMPGSALFRLGAPFPDTIEEISMVHKVPYKICESAQTILKTHEGYLNLGYEGTMMRGVESPYKHGRGTLKDMCLMKLKPKYDAEAMIIGCTQMISAQGRLEAVGSITCETDDGTTFEIGTGFDSEWRHYYWKHLGELLNKQVTYTYEGFGSKGRPRFPVFKAFRDKE